MLQTEKVTEDQYAFLGTLWDCILVIWELFHANPLHNSNTIESVCNSHPWDLGTGRLIQDH